jgi:hypothetical protein
MRGKVAKTLKKIARLEYSLNILNSFTEQMKEEFMALPEEEKMKILFADEGKKMVKLNYKKLKHSVDKWGITYTLRNSHEVCYG